MYTLGKQSKHQRTKRNKRNKGGTGRFESKQRNKHSALGNPGVCFDCETNKQTAPMPAEMFVSRNKNTQNPPKKAKQNKTHATTGQIFSQPAILSKARAISAFLICSAICIGGSPCPSLSPIAVFYSIGCCVPGAVPGS
jgi:hypothetical protein